MSEVRIPLGDNVLVFDSGDVTDFSYASETRVTGATPEGAVTRELTGKRTLLLTFRPNTNPMWEDA